MSNFRPIDRDTGFLLPPSVDEWLPERHLARFVVEVIAGLDLRSMTGSYRGSGEASYHPELLLGLIVYGYATGVFSSRKLERATYDSVAFRFIAANEHPDHDTISAFRRRFLKQIELLFVQVLCMAREMGVLKLGTVALDGTKIRPPPCKDFWQCFDRIACDHMSGLLVAAAHDRWPRWFPRREFQTRQRPTKASGSSGVPLVLDRSTTPSAHSLASSGLSSAGHGSVVRRGAHCWPISRRHEP
jgi:transposase